FSLVTSVARLKVHPEVGRLVESSAQPYGRVRRNRSFAMHDFVDASRRHMERLGQAVLGNAEFFKHFGQMSTRMRNGQRFRGRTNNVPDLHRCKLFSVDTYFDPSSV